MWLGNQTRFAGALCFAALMTGCAPLFTEVVQPQEKRIWVERTVQIEHAQIGSIESAEFVNSTSLANVVGPDERVIWIAGVDIMNSRFQRTSERLQGVDAAKFGVKSNGASIVQAHQFGVQDASLSVEGQIALDGFTANESARYYVEFLNKGTMTEQKINEMMDAWKGLSANLKKRGLNTANVIMGGSKYDQKVNAIVLVKVGK